MQLTKGAIGNLINRYKAVLKKCHLLNVFGSLAVAGMLIMGGAAAAGAADIALGAGGSYNATDEVNHLMGGGLYKDNQLTADTSVASDITLSVKGGSISEIIGGSYISGTNADYQNATHGTITTTISGNTTSAEFVVGGSKLANNDGAALETGTTAVTIDNGTFGKEDTGGYELVMGGKTGLEAIERTVIDRAVKAIYRPYLANPCPENMPILSDLHQALLDQHLPEADRVAQALDLYVSGSLNVFNHKTNVDIHNRLVAFDIKELGKQLKKLGMLIIQDQIWGRVTQNRSQGRATWYFADEFHLLLKEEQTAAYSAEIWKRFRKWGGVPTGATQNVKDLLSSPEIENILENSDFITLLNQASGDRKILSERLNLSADQQKYIDNSEPGEGLLIFENVVLPFSNPIPKNTQLYKIMTTRLNEVVEL